jgi:Fic family protein
MKEIEQLVKEYKALNLHEIIDYDKFNHFAIVHHSTSIEGTTLTENETRLLLEEGVTPKGKPLEHSLMTKDHYNALLFILESAKNKVQCTTEFIKNVNAIVMKSTGNIYNTALGQVDATRGEFRKGNVSAGGHYFISYDKVEKHTDLLVKKIQETMKASQRFSDLLKLSFDVHFDLVSIHPFYDGNGRTSRLLMNYIQQYYDLPLAIVYKEDKSEYFTALQTSTEKEDLTPFRDFMTEQYKKYLLHEINQFNQDLVKKILPKKRTGKRKGFSLF